MFLEINSLDPRLRGDDGFLVYIYFDQKQGRELNAVAGKCEY